MSKDFIEVECVQYGDNYIVNINNITFSSSGWRGIFINGVTGDGNSIINITEESHERLMRMVKDRMWSDEE